MATAITPTVNEIRCTPNDSAQYVSSETVRAQPIGPSRRLEPKPNILRKGVERRQPCAENRRRRKYKNKNASDKHRFILSDLAQHCLTCLVGSLVIDSRINKFVDDIGRQIYQQETKGKKHDRALKLRVVRAKRSIG
jgi:hypothetical protein